MTALDDFVAASAVSYLQSVVFVDDKIYETGGGRPLELSPAVDGLGSGLRPQFEKAGDDADIQDEAKEIEVKEGSTAVENVAKAMEAEPPQYHPRELMESFARRGIVCALYEPRQGFETGPNSDIFRLCERADVVILDWDLYNDDGDAVSELLVELIKKSAETLPHHVRLCALYTDRPNLHQVMDRLLAKLQQRECSVDAEEGKLRLIAGATRIAVFGKPVTVGRPPDDTAYEVKESQLADKIIEEFAVLHHGLMPAFALHGLAAIRRNTKRLLDKFSSELDGAFLLHRALVLKDDDAFDELPELLSDEIRAVLEDMWPGKTPVEAVTSATVESLPLSDLDPSWTTRNGGRPYDSKPAFRKMLLQGEQGLNDAREASNNVKDFKDFRGIKPALLTDFGKFVTKDGRNSSEFLAALFCNRTQYGSSTRVLRFGTVIRHRPLGGGNWEYSVCLMPICDSQRLDKQYAFPFWTLRENAEQGLSGKRHGVVVIDPDGVAHALTAGGKIRDMLWMTNFNPGADGTVGAVYTENAFRFTQADKAVEWMAELKPLHAQRIATYMGAEAARVGLVESEWLRLFCDR
jgi:hypothetical protein